MYFENIRILLHIFDFLKEGQYADSKSRTTQTKVEWLLWIVLQGFKVAWNLSITDCARIQIEIEMFPFGAHYVKAQFRFQRNQVYFYFLIEDDVRLC